jgi:peptidoglycan/xylan/chitin deacetylase (PgdA/CDA1 family)
VHASGAVVFTYHDIDDEPANATSYLATPDRFRSQLRSFMAWGLRFVELGELCELCDRHRRDESLDGLAAVSFDDGLQGVYQHALPILRELDVPATGVGGQDSKRSALRRRHTRED